ncbi:MAG TPA: AAA family ATPase [Thermoanaerobaculia bacterium]|jgi:hypothetical protein
MSTDFNISFPPDLLRILTRWNRWGTAPLNSGVRRRITGELAPFLDTPEVVALVGPRRAGKTTVLFQLMDDLEAAGVPREACLHVNLEEQALMSVMGPELLERLYETYRVEVFPEGRAYLFLDEVQQASGWERWVRSRNETEDVKIFVTGSSAKLMSPELATLLTGRHVSFRVLPLEFREFLDFRGVELPARPRLVGTPPRIQQALHAYLRWGGFPEVVLAGDERRKEVLLKQYFDDALFKDVALRHQIRDLSLLRNLAVYLLGQTASFISAERLARIFSVSSELARTYCGYLEEAFLVSFVPFYTLKTAERLRRPRKVYAVDTGLRNAVCLTGSPDHGRLMETAVHGALERVGHDGLFYWKDEVEVDFAVRRGLSVRSLIQVVGEGLEKVAVRTRELRSLERARSAFPQAERFLVAGSLPGPGSMPGEASEDPEVRWIPLWRFLTEAGDEARIVEGRSAAPAAPDGSAADLEERLLRHVRRHGRVTRREAAELGGLSRPQASRLLGRLVEAGRIVRRGTGGGTFYALS